MNYPLSLIGTVKKNSRIVLSCVFVALFMVGVAFVFADTRMHTQQNVTQATSKSTNAVLGANEDHASSASDTQSDASTEVPQSSAQTSDAPSPTRSTPSTSTSKAQIDPQTAQSSNTQTTANASQTPTVTTPASIAVHLSINGNSVGSLTLADGSTQCDVLNVALQNGLIASLDMRYFGKPLYSYGVYAINGQGDAKQVYWVYTVNGKSPPYGCSRVQAVSGDNINWKYIGR